MEFLEIEKVNEEEVIVFLCDVELLFIVVDNGIVINEESGFVEDGV